MSADTPESTGETATSAQIPGPKGTRPESSGNRNQGTASEQDPSSFDLCPRADTVPQPSIPKFLLERNSFPGVLTHRLTGGTSHNQRQQEQLTPEITRWLKARAIT